MAVAPAQLDTSSVSPYGSNVYPGRLQFSRTFSLDPTESILLTACSWIWSRVSGRPLTEGQRQCVNSAFAIGLLDSLSEVTEILYSVK